MKIIQAVCVCILSVGVASAQQPTVNEPTVNTDLLANAMLAGDAAVLAETSRAVGTHANNASDITRTDIATGWLRINRSNIDGTPTIDGQSGIYDGKIDTINGGVDHIYDAGGDSNLLFGFGVGYQQAEYDIAIDSTESNSSSQFDRHTFSAFPYAELRGENTLLQLMLGYGVGEIQVAEVDGAVCEGTVDQSWYFGNLGSEVAAYRTDVLRFSFYGNLRHSRSNNDPYQSMCINAPVTNGGTSPDLAIAENAVRNSEASAGLRINFGPESLQAYVFSDTRKLFGDFSDDIAHEGGGGLDVAYGSLRMRVEVRRQYSATTHNRRNINGMVEWHNDKWSSQFISGFHHAGVGGLGNLGGVESSGRLGSLASLRNFANFNGEEAYHRLQINHRQQWHSSAIDSGIYVERRHTATNAGAELRIAL